MLRNLHTFVRWGLLAAATGLVIGGFSTLFAASLRFVTDFRTERPWMIFFLPLSVCIRFAHFLQSCQSHGDRTKCISFA